MSHEQDRDAAVERLLRRTNAPGRLDSTESCPGPETFAAWVDGDLTPAARRAAEAHTSQCARCQSILAVMVQTDDAAAPQTDGVQGLTGFRRSLRWLVPLTGGALAATLWLAVRPDTRPPAEPAASVLFERGVEAPPPPSGAEPTPAPTERDAPSGRADESRRRESAPSRRAAAERQQASPDAQEKIGSRKPDALLDAAVPKPQQVVELPGTVVPPTASAPASVSAPPPSAGAARAENVAPATPVVGSQAFRMAVERLLVASPDPSSRWRITAGRTVEHSTDGGTAWTDQVVPPGLVLLAGTAPSANVCWIVGRAGTVLLTTDARTWQRVAFPEPVDLTAVHAADARSATVQSADGKTFHTADGGQTWARR